MKIFKKERFSVFKANRAAKKEWIYELRCRCRLEGNLTLENGIFYLDGEEIFKTEGTNKIWKQWYQLCICLEEKDEWSFTDGSAKFKRSKKNWPKRSLRCDWKSSSRNNSCMSAKLTREKIARDKAEKGIR